MKALFSEEYYRQHWDDFMKRVSGEDYINLEEELDYKMETFKDTEIPEEVSTEIKEFIRTIEEEER